ncbi:MAG: hypothetical protein CTY24_14920, partial [Methylobacter sp.]
QTSGQGNLAGGHSPVWHGASSSSDGHRNAAAQWGIRSKEFGGSGYNQLLFDDSDHQGRVQLKTTQAATELNLGHLRHTADNFRGSFRGLGAELRTDAYGALRAGAGWLVSSFPIEHSASRRDPAGDNAPGMAHLKHLTQLAATFNQAATLHQTVPLAVHRGTTGAGHSLLSADKAPQAPLAAQLTAVSGMADSQSLAAAQADAQSKTTQASHTKVPHSTDPLIALTAQGGLTLTAAHSLQLANGEAITLASGHDSQFITGGPWRLNTGQAIGVLAGATAPGPNQLGLQVIAAQDPIDLRAHNGTLAVQAQHALTLTSSHAHSDWAAAQGISISTAAGANITIDNGNITVQCPGKLTIQAGKKSFIGPGRVAFNFPAMPRSTPPGNWISTQLLDLDSLDYNVSGMPYEIHFNDGSLQTGLLDATGKSQKHLDVSHSGVKKIVYQARPALPEHVAPGHKLIDF